MKRALAVRTSPIHGRGVFALRNLPARRELIRYRGRLLTPAQADAGYEPHMDTGHTLLFILNDDWVIDASVDGNSARFINHSCQPNCEAVIVESARGRRYDRVMIQSRRRIRAGEELTYDYGIEIDGPPSARERRLWACRCGAPRCRGTMLKVKKKR